MLKINPEIDLEWLMNKFGLRYCPHDKKSVKKQGFPSWDLIANLNNVRT